MAHDIPHDRPFTTADLMARGISRHRLQQRLLDGTVRQLLYGVYVPADWGDSPAAKARAAALVVPAHCVVTDRSAASLHGIDLHDAVERDVAPVLEIVSVGGARATRRAGVLGGNRALRPDEITVIDGVRVTTVLRTACDIACLRGRWRAIGALDAFRTAYGISEADLVAMLPRFRARRGVTQLRELVPLSRTGVDSQPESWIRITIYDEGYPMPAAQVWVWVDGWGRAKIENAWEHLRIGVEYDGLEFHSSPEDRAHDQKRRAALAAAGWIIIVVRRDGLTLEGRATWLAELGAAYGSRAPAFGRRTYARAPEQRRRGR
ncbi:hypothetical protein [Nocardioides stalactiti]|uniref:hypothetical protein n=1 Tax=Nocardioides stalactiti TaxID=2755356 RepID=UPI00160230C1|nr:hypothetical protein [Nocardioides stalactiti]